LGLTNQPNIKDKTMHISLQENLDHYNTRLCAYYLWEEAGRPGESSVPFWNAAVFRLTPRTWYVFSGDLRVSGHGTFDEILGLSVIKADDDGMSLEENINISSFGFEDICPVRKNTLKLFQELGLWV
jgi:hypothetical protein